MLKTWRFDPLPIDGSVEELDGQGIPLSEPVTPNKRLRRPGRSKVLVLKSVMITLLLYGVWTGLIIALAYLERGDPMAYADTIPLLGLYMAAIWLWSVIIAKIFRRL